MIIELDQPQLDAIEKLKSGNILCGDTGSGKSRTALAYFLKRVCGGSLCVEENEHLKNPVPLYIITTAKKMDNREWHEEARQCGIFEDGSFSGIKLTVDSWNNIAKYVNVDRSFFIFDEQRLVGKGKWVNSFFRIAAKNQWLMLTATPGDCWIEYFPVFKANGFYKTRYEFTSMHVIWKTWSKFPDIKGYYNEGLLMKHRRDIVVELPVIKHTNQIHKTIYLPYDMDKSRMVLRNRFNPYLHQPIEDAGELCRVLRQISNEDPSRLQSVEILMHDHPKVIIFYNFDYELEILRKLPTVIAEWNGHKHDPLPEGDHWAYLVQYNAGAEGWNCTTTDTVIFYSQSYSYKITKQAAGRIDRRNTPFTDLFYFHLSSKSKIDIAIERALNKKKDFNASTFARIRKT